MVELRDIDVNEVEAPVESSPTEAPTVEDAVEEPVKEKVLETPEVVEEATENTSTEEPVKVQEEPKESEPTETKEPKRSRAEERIRNLARENREMKEKIEKFSSQASPELQGDEIAYDDLNKVINERALQAAELLMAGNKVESEYQTQVGKWAEDFEKVKSEHTYLDPKSPDYDAELDNTLAQLLDDGSGSGTPRTDIMVSDILKTLGRRESSAQLKAKEEGKSEVTARLAKQSAEGAITPNTKVSEPSSEELSDEESANLRTADPKAWFDKL